MKIRTGFVSNSSSSSFIAGFKTIPRCIEDVKYILFGDDEWYFSSYRDDRYSTQTVAETVYNDMKNKQPLSLKAFFKATEEMADIDYEDEKFRNPGGAKYDIDWEKLTAFKIVKSKKMAQKFIDANKDYYFYEFSYSDEDGSYGSALEHGGLFNRVPNICMSHH